MEEQEPQDPDTPAADEPRFVQRGRSLADDPTITEHMLIEALDRLSLDRFRVVVFEALNRKHMWQELVDMGVEPPPEPPVEP
jgi:hypothetical protein